ncbi:peptidoglycan-binding protein LysM [Mannheimia sp. AT1]|uniref:Peptidoglycan-binding protein LysM n=1 Tax=Mannheimia cairinae TaxID=3025936 RepID=A0ABT5MR49_9PAST|nr:CHAP domain-containing protein [Mannheimia cairinae]MDD0824665.1 peptidoglycan-binding protein LysM [Mannheimia cairinae]MDD0826406.1 peptidoglycan-binding protein LysM [Mannheimia cairinae]
MSDVIDTLAIEIAANDSFTAVAKPLLSLLERLEDAVNKNTEALGDYEKATERTAKSTEKVNAAQDKSEKSAKKSTKALKEQEKQVKKNEKAAKNLLQAIGGFTKAIGALGTMIFAGVGLDRLAQEAAKTNKELDVTSKNLGMTSQSLATWRGAAELSGGSARGLTGYLNNLSAGLTRLTVQGDASVTQFFSQLGINLLDGSQKAKKLEDIMLELADKFSTMDRVKAFNIAQQMGIDEGTFEMLAQGRQGLEENLQKTAKIYKSNQQDLETARKLTAATSYLNQQFEGLKLMIANAAMPVLLKIADVTNAFFEYLQKNENLVKGVFFGIAGAITAVMMPALLKGAAAALAFIAPFLPMILIVAGLATAFGLLYDDYQTWANGGTSLFNWEKFQRWIIDADYSVDNLKDAFADLLGGYKSWDEMIADDKNWLKMKGFIDDNGVSVGSLLRGFQNLTKDLLEAVLPAIQRVWGVISKLLDGDFSGAWEETKQLASDSADYVMKKAENARNFITDSEKGLWGTIKNKTFRFMDIWSGHDPDKGENSLTHLVNDSSLLQTSKETAEAAAYAVANAAEKSAGKCALYVNNALRAQGVKINGHGVDVASNLLKSNQGFSEVKYSDSYVPQIGDVMSMPSHSKSDHKYGHVAIYTEQGWVSDFKQGNKYGNTAAANRHYFDEIKSGKIKPTIARRYNKDMPKQEGYSGDRTVKGLDQAETAALVSKVVSKESGGKLDAVNSYGYLGLYQFGAEALADIGLIDRKKYEQAVAKYGKGLSSGSDAKLHKAFLEDESNWKLQGGQKAFLANKKVQDEAMIRLLNKNAQYLGNVYSGNSDHKAGLLMAAHLKGWSKAKEYATTGKDSKDAYGTSVSSYYNAGRQAVSRVKENATEPNYPLGGYAVANALNANQHKITTMQNLAQPQNINNNQKTEVAFNGGIHINSTAGTLSGTALDLVNGVQNRVNVMQFNTGLS